MRVDGNEVFVMCSAEIINVDEFIDDSSPLYLSEYKWISYFNRFSASLLRKIRFSGSLTGQMQGHQRSK